MYHSSIECIVIRPQRSRSPGQPLTQTGCKLRSAPAPACPSANNGSLCDPDALSRQPVLSAVVAKVAALIAAGNKVKNRKPTTRGSRCVRKSELARPPPRHTPSTCPATYNTQYGNGRQDTDVQRHITVPQSLVVGQDDARTSTSRKCRATPLRKRALCSSLDAGSSDKNSIDSVQLRNNCIEHVRFPLESIIE